MLSLRTLCNFILDTLYDFEKYLRRDRLDFRRHLVKSMGYFFFCVIRIPRIIFKLSFFRMIMEDMQREVLLHDAFAVKQIPLSE